MANPQLEHGYTRIANAISEAIMLRDFSKRQRKIVDLIFRLSYGCNKKSAYIPRLRDFEVVGITEAHVGAELKWLAESKVITIEGQQYLFNKNFDEWQVSRVKPHKPEELAGLIGLNLRIARQDRKSSDTNLAKMESPNLPKQQVPTYQNGKLSEPESASPKDNTKDNPKTATTGYEPDRGESRAGLALAVKKYEENLGMVTPIVAQELAGAVLEYPASWVVDAIAEAVRNNVRRWSYVSRILERWKTEGRDNRRSANRDEAIPGQRPAGAFDDLE